MKKLIPIILKEFKLSPTGDHGLSHWARVLRNGRILANETADVNLKVVEHFAILHDVGREKETGDKNHGLRSAAFVRRIRKEIKLTDDEVILLAMACEAHSFSSVTAIDTTIKVCWDSDRLDLGRVGYTPDKGRLFTDAAKQPELILSATHDAYLTVLPPLVKREWGINFKPTLLEKMCLEYREKNVDDFMRRVKKDLNL